MYTYQQTVETIDPAVGSVVVPRKNNAAADRYRKEEAMNLTPVQIICKIYDIAIIAAKKKDLELSRRAINELIAALNFDYEETALGLYRLYDYSKKCLREGKAEEAINVLQELRSAWAEAFHLGKHAPE